MRSNKAGFEFVQFALEFPAFPTQILQTRKSIHVIFFDASPLCISIITPHNTSIYRRNWYQIFQNIYANKRPSNSEIVGVEI